jgi:hypothetical protein
MRIIIKRIFSLTLILSLILGMAPGSAAVALTEQQSNAIAMLNYITILTQEINASKNSRVFMEQAYTSLINNTNPNSVDNRTLSQLTALLDTMESYRMLNVKRERLQYIYEQNKAQAIRAAIPNPIGLLSTVSSLNPMKLAMSITYMAVDSLTSYNAYATQNDLQFLQSGWALDDTEAETLHESRKGTFAYMIKMVGAYGLPGDLTLTENTVYEFVNWKNNPNVIGRIRFLESNHKTYKAYGGYWLTLAESYYQNGDYKKCLDAIAAYEGLGTRIFRKDYDLANILPLAITAAAEIQSTDEYIPFAEKYAQAILNNTEHSDWSLRFFAAVTYVGLYSKTNDQQYLQMAYDVALDNANYLVDEQQQANAAYLAPVALKSTNNLTDNQKKEAEQYNKMLQETRKTGLAPINEPLTLNCDLLFSLANELRISEAEQKKIEGVLHPNSDPLFLIKTIDEKYRFAAPTIEEFEIEYGGTTLIVPAAYLTSGCMLKVSVKEANESAAEVFTDWKLEAVNRGTEDDLSTFQAAFVSEAAKSHDWKPDATIIIDIFPNGDESTKPYHYEYTTNNAKKEWYDYLKVWEGQKNNWYDYLKVWESSVTFERVK